MRMSNPEEWWVRLHLLGGRNNYYDILHDVVHVVENL